MCGADCAGWIIGHATSWKASHRAIREEGDLFLIGRSASLGRSLFSTGRDNIIIYVRSQETVLRIISSNRGQFKDFNSFTVSELTQQRSSFPLFALSKGDVRAHWLDAGNIIPWIITLVWILFPFPPKILSLTFDNLLSICFQGILNVQQLP